MIFFAVLPVVGFVFSVKAQTSSTPTSTASSSGPSATVITQAPPSASASASGSSNLASALPLTEYTFTYPNVPYQVNPYPSGRGPQTGYNICNSTTEGPGSLCQTAWVNSIDDFCLWGAPQPNSVVGRIEGEVVAYCTKKGHGTRLIPPGTLTAVQFIKTPGYIQITGRLNQVGIGLAPDDEGGELDPHGADLAGNPLGGIVFSNNLPKTNGTIVQVNNWNSFIGWNSEFGEGEFCIKACENSIRSPNYCENRFDEEGCNFNMPAAYRPNEFSECLGDNQAPPGNTPVVIPATSSCTTYTSSLLYGVASTSTASSSIASTTSSVSGAASAVRSGAAASGTPSSSSSSSAVVKTSPGAGLFAVLLSIILGTLVCAVMLL